MTKVDTLSTVLFVTVYGVKSLQQIEPRSVAEAYGLNARQSKLLALLSEGVAEADALAAAGYAENSTLKTLIASNPRLAAAALTATKLRLHGLAGAAVAVLEEIVTNSKEFDPKLRLDAAKTILDRVGIAPQKTGATPSEGRGMSEMSVDELRAHVEALEHELGNRARPVDAPDAPVEDAQVLDALR